MTRQAPASIGQSLRTMRMLAGLTLEDVAREADTAVAYLSKIETDKLIPSKTYVGTVTAVLSRALSPAPPPPPPAPDPDDGIRLAHLDDPVEIRSLEAV
nr:helix-turn-helix transcriptional regulator [Rathayibacter sp. VKM Ac-2804]